MNNTFKEVINTLVYDKEKSLQINPEAEELIPPHVKTKSKDPFVKYILGLSYIYKQDLIVLRSDPDLNRYQFKCSCEGCEMKLIFKTMDGKIFINKDESNFVHKHRILFTHNPKYRILEKTYNEFEEWCRYCGSTLLFAKLHKEEL